MNSSPTCPALRIWRVATTVVLVAALTMFTVRCSSTAEEEPTVGDDDAGTTTDGSPLDGPEETGGPRTPDGGLEEASITAHTLTYHRDIQPILQNMCVRCHSDGAIQASTPLTTYEEVVPWADAIRHQVKNRLMPPWRAAEGCTGYRYDESMLQEEIDQVVAWVDDGSPEGDPDETPVEARTIELASLTRVDLVVEMTEPYTPQMLPDEWRCFVLPWPEESLKYVTGFGTVPGVPGMVHHVAAWVVEPGFEAPYLAWEMEAEAPGYPCFGGPSGPGGAETNQGAVRFLNAWNAGLYGVDMPAGLGEPVLPGSHIVLQVHYNVQSAEPEPDQTAMVFMLDDEVENSALIQPWTNLSWIMQGGMDIPAGVPLVTHTYSADPWALPPFVAPFKGKAAARLYTVALHMHLLGVSGRVSIERVDGTTECLLHIPDYSFEWQRVYSFDEPRVLYPGDRLSIECNWDNSAANQPSWGGIQQTPSDVDWGEDTNDEMCLGFFVTVPLDEAPPKVQ